MIRRRFHFCLLIVLFLLSAPACPSARAEEWLKVQRVIDGDTVVLQDSRHIRLIGINAPEYEPWKNFIEPYGPEARRFLKKYIEGQDVRLEFDVEKKDRYHRDLAYLWMRDGVMVNRKLVQEGLARARYYRPNGKHRSELEADEQEAKKKRVGLWSRKEASASKVVGDKIAA